MSLEERAVVELLRNTVDHLPQNQQMVLIAARQLIQALGEGRFFVPTAEQLDDIAEEAATRISCSGRKAWKVKDTDGNTVRMTPFAVAKMHEQYLSKYKKKALELHKEMKLMVLELSATIDDLKEKVEAIQEQQAKDEITTNARLRALEAHVRGAQ